MTRGTTLFKRCIINQRISSCRPAPISSFKSRDLVITFKCWVLLTQGQRVWTAFCRNLRDTPPLDHMWRPKYTTWPYLAKGKGEIERIFFCGHTSWVFANGFKAGELIRPSVALSRVVFGQWSKVGSLGRVHVVIVGTFEEKKGEWSSSTMLIFLFTVYCKSQEF